jgi:hypothetical protein
MTSSLLSPYLRQVVSGRQVFFWEVYGGSFRIVASAGKMPAAQAGGLQQLDTRPPFLVCRPEQKRFYAPLRNTPVLHRTFCELSDNRAMVSFASKYGLLG